ncbi:MAG: Hsp33 family molecular chaperone HslO, partial [Methanomicrobiales archaeon]|nr:Hsp33 family molecular chaperone HslO [Methanomicrobiales archaeon]
MSEQAQALSAPAGDFVLPFDITRAGVRGRFVRLDTASAQALDAHRLPEPAARVTGEALALATLLGSALKLDGRLTVQTNSSGPLDLVTADYYGSAPVQGADDGVRSARGVRGYARLNADGFAALDDAAFAGLAGEGVLAITIEPKRGGQTYQGIVSLSPDGLAASAEIYFAQSEQLPTVMRLAAAPLYVAGEKSPRWRAAGLMLQMTPEASNAPGRNEDDWTRLSLLARTVEDLELVDTGLAPETVLWRLFHEDEVRVQPTETVSFRCDCDA